MKKIRALIVDDEPLARDRVRMLLEPHEDLEVIGEAADGEMGLRVIEAVSPDLVFLDIQMPGLGGLEMLEKIDPERRPLVIFLTAYNEYAVDAFDAAALDYVLKPVDPERFEKALERARLNMQSRNGRAGAQDSVERMLTEWGTPDRPKRFIVRKAKGRRVLVNVDDIVWVSAERNYARLNTSAGSHLLRETMSRMEQVLDPARFVRIHRSSIVRIDSIRSIESEADGSFFITMEGGERLSVGSAYRDNLEQALGQSL